MKPHYHWVLKAEFGWFPFQFGACAVSLVLVFRVSADYSWVDVGEIHWSILYQKQRKRISSKMSSTLQPIFASKKLEQDLKPKEIKPSIVSQHCVVIFKFACDPCDADYAGYTARHFHQRIAVHKYSAIGKHLLEAHGDKNLLQLMRANFAFSKSDTGNLTALFTKCYSSKNRGLALTLRVTLSVLNSLFSL